MDFILQHTSAHIFSSFFLQIHCLYVFWIWYCAENTSFPLLLIKPKFCEENLRYIRILANHKLVFHLTTPESDISIVKMMMIIDHSWSTYGNTWLINSSRWDLTTLNEEKITFEPDVDVELQFHDILYLHHSGLVDIFVFAQNLWC